MIQILDVISKIEGGLVSQASVIMTVLGVLFALSKMISNEKAGPVVSRIQAGFDKLAQAFLGVGNIFKKISEALALVIQSDGILGKK